MSLGGGADISGENFGAQRAAPKKKKKKTVSKPKKKKKSHSICILPELACDVTKSKITAKVIWASLILRLTFHLIWVSMTARDVHGKWIHFSTWRN